MRFLSIAALPCWAAFCSHLIFTGPVRAMPKFHIPDNPIQLSQTVRRGKYIESAGRRAMSRMAAAVGDSDLAARAGKDFARASAGLDGKFWNPKRRLLSFALGEAGERNDETTAWTAVALLFGLIPPEHAGPVIEGFAGASMSTDWGVRMLSSDSASYEATSYNNGTVWPFLNGFVSWAEYRNHRPAAGFLHWAQSAHQTCNNALGYVPELLSGDFNVALDTAVPHQLFSSSAVLTPLIKGMLGFYPSANEREVELAPHMPARWKEAKASNLRVGKGSLALSAKREPETVVFKIEASGLPGYVVKFSAGLEAGAAVKEVRVNGTAVTPRLTETRDDLHCDLEIPVTGSDEIRIGLAPGLRVLEPLEPAPVGESSRQARIVRVSWDRASAAYTIVMEGRGGSAVEIEIIGPSNLSQRRLRVDFPPPAGAYARRDVRVNIP